MKSILIATLLLLAAGLTAQNCDCGSQLAWVMAYYEQNNPAFQQLKANREAYSHYNKEIQKIKAAAVQEKDEDRCILQLDQYVLLLKDHHSNIGFNLERADLSTPELIEAFKNAQPYRQFEKIAVDTAKLLTMLQNRPIASIEGIYSDGRNLLFGIIKKENTRNQYRGVVLKRTKLLEPGHILIELTQQKNNTFDVVYNIGLLGFNFQKIFKNITIENGQMPDLGFAKTTASVAGDQEVRPYAFTALNASTNYLRLSDFDRSLTEELDVFYDSIATEIKRRPFLIIDLRNNGGGSDNSYVNLLQYAYTRPLQFDLSEVWVSPDNIQRYEEFDMEAYTTLISRMKKAPSLSFIPQSEDPSTEWKLDSVTVFPKKIAVLMDRGTASSAEGMIFHLLQSDKVVTIGENSGGYIGYGNVMTAQTPCGKFTVQSTTTKYAQKSKYEFVGIPPMYPVSKKKDWVKYAEKLLQKSR